MKKLLLVALLMLALVITAVACNGNETVETTAGETTAAQTPATAEPEDSTAAPETPTEAPEVPTEAPEVPTEAPEVPTEAPEVPTQAPVVTTEPETEAPVDPMAPINVFEAADIQTITGGDPKNLTQDCVSIVDNYLHIVPIGADPYWYPFASVDGGRYVAIRYRTDATGADMQLYIASSGNGPTDDTTMIRLAVVADGEWHLAVFDTQSLIEAGKYDGEYVSYFRFDPLEAGYLLNENGETYKNEDGSWARHTLPEGCYIDVEYIAFFNSAEAAEKFGGDTPAEPEKYDNLTVPQDQWVITGHNTNLNDSSNPMVAAGGVDSAALLHQGSIYLGELDLSKYSKVVVMWGCDNSGVTQGHYDANANNRIMLLNAVMDGVMSPAEETIIAGGTYELGGWAVQAFEIDLTNVSYNGPVYVAIDALPGTFALFASVEFIGAEIPAAPETPDEPETPTVELTPFTEKFHANVDFINGGSKDGAGVPYQSLGTSKINGTDGVLVVLNAAENNIVVNADNTINLQGWMAVQGGINHYAYAVNGGELITAVGGADGEPLADYYAGLGMADSTKMGLFNGGNKLIADLSAYAGQTITVTFYAIPEAAQDTVAPIVSVEGLVVPAAAEEPVEDYNVPMESWTISGHQPQLITPDVAGIGPIVAAAGMEKAALIHQGSVGVGAVDLSKYSKVVIQYTTDASQPTYDLYNASGKQIYVLNAQMHMVNSPDAATVITSATFALPELNQSWKMQTIEIDLSAIDYSGDVFIAWDTLAGSFMVIASVEFIA